jgi:hypothetical protein
MTVLIYDAPQSNLHTDARRELLMAKMKLPEYWKNMDQNGASRL